MRKSVDIESSSYEMDEISFEDLFTVEELQRIQDSFSNTMGVASMITTPDGEPITQPSNFCRLCRDIIRKTEKGKAHCRQSDASIGKPDIHGTRMKKCLSGCLWDAGASIVVGKKHIANWLIGQVLDGKPNYSKMKKYAVEIGADVDEFMNAVEEIPIMSKEKLKSTADYLFIFANQISKLAWSNYQMKQEIQARKAAEKLLYETKEQLSLVVNQIPGVIWALNLNLVFTLVDGSILKMLKLVQDDILGKSLLDFVKWHNIDPQIIDCHVSALSGDVCQYEMQFSEMYVNVFLKPLFDKDKKINGVLGVAIDVTNKKRTEVALKESEQRFQDVAEAAGEFLWEIDLLYHFTFITKKVEEILGYSREEILGKTPLDFCFQSEGKLIKNYLDHILIEKKSFSDFELKVIDRSGKILWLNVSGTPFYNSDGTLKGFRGTALDISVRKKAENLLMESERKYRELYQATQDGWIKLSMSGIILQYNRAYKSMIGYSDEELRFGKIINFFPDKWLAFGRKILEEEVFEKGFSENYEMEHIKKDGTVAPIEFRLYLAKENGVAVGIWGFVRDISERKKAEREKELLITDLENKNAEMEKFTYTVSHDLRSPLITIKGFTGMITQDIIDGNTERAIRDMDRISKAADKMKLLLEDLLELSRIGRIVNTPEEVDLNILFTELLETMSAQISQTNAKIYINNKLPFIYVDKIRITEVFQNLLENAVKFSSNSECPVININGTELDDFYEISIQDNGIGIEQKYQNRIFGLFEKLNNNDSGTGVGLALVKRIIEIHGGKIKVFSEGLDKGSTFTISLPKSNLLNSINRS